MSFQEHFTDVDETASANTDCGGPPGSAIINQIRANEQTTLKRFKMSSLLAICHILKGIESVYCK